MEIDLKKYNTHAKVSRYFELEYSKTQKPIPVSFRDLLPKDNKKERYTHLIHSYPAKLLVNIPSFFLNNEYFVKKKGLILDPFCGTGTVLLEALLNGKNSIGADANPLAQLISKVKVTYINSETLNLNLKLIFEKIKRIRKPDIPDVVNLDFWFFKDNQRQLGLIKKAIKDVTTGDVQDFFSVCFSSCVKKVSYADPRISVPVKLNPLRFPEGSERNAKTVKKLKEIESVNIYKLFQNVCKNNIASINKLKSFTEVTANVISKDARKITTSINSDYVFENNSVDLVLTSPPYAGAQKYIRSSSLNLGWLDLVSPNNLKLLDKKNIGRENYQKHELKKIITGIRVADQLLEQVYSINKTRAYIVGNYLIELMSALDESIRVLKKNAYLIIIIGNNKVCNFEFNTQQYLTEYLISKNLELKFKLIDDIKSYGLMTKRNKTADIISREWVLAFKK